MSILGVNAFTTANNKVLEKHWLAVIFFSHWQWLYKKEYWLLNTGYFIPSLWNTLYIYVRIFYIFSGTEQYVHICQAGTVCVDCIIGCLHVRLNEHVSSMSPTRTELEQLYSTVTAAADTHQEIQKSQVAGEATLKPGLEDEFPSSFSHSHTPSPQIVPHWTIPSLSDDASHYCTPFLSLFLSPSISNNPPYFVSYFTPFFFFFNLSPDLHFDFFLSAPPLSLYNCV